MYSFSGFMLSINTLLHIFAMVLYYCKNNWQPVCIYGFLQTFLVKPCQYVYYIKTVHMCPHDLNFRHSCVSVLMVSSTLEEVLVFQGGYAR